MKIENFIKKFGHNVIKQSIESNKNRGNISVNLFGYTNGKATRVIKEYIEKYDINTDHFDRQWKNRKYEKSIKKICPQCQKEFETNGRDDNITCSCKCSNIYFAYRRKATGTKDAKCYICGEHFKIKVQANIDKVYCEECKSKRLHIKIFDCTECGKKIRKTKSGMCRKCFSKSDENREAQRKMMKKRVEKGIHSGWKSREGKKPSYPEKYFMKVLKEEGISYVKDKYVGGYFPDFLIDRTNVILEVDGKQHLRRKKKDIKRDTKLTNMGFTVYRIQWYNPTNDERKKKLYRQIKEFYDIIGHETSIVL